MRIPKSCELLVLQDFVESLETWKFRNYIWFEKGFLENIFEDCALILIYFVCWKKNFEAKKVLERNFYTDKIKEGFW